MDAESGLHVDGLEADMATTLRLLSAVRECSILAVSVRALEVLRKVSSLNNCSSVEKGTVLGNVKGSRYEIFIRANGFCSISSESSKYEKNAFNEAILRLTDLGLNR